MRDDRDATHTVLPIGQNGRSPGESLKRNLFNYAKRLADLSIFTTISLDVLSTFQHGSVLETVSCCAGLNGWPKQFTNNARLPL
jgi:hypothetical protein